MSVQPTDDARQQGELDALAGAVDAHERTENFRVAPGFLPSRVRAELRAIYRFARLVDDAGDEAPGDRQALLDAVEADIDRHDSGARPRRADVAAVADVLTTHGHSTLPLRRLIAANRQDQQVHDYATYDELAAYCTLSANPVGEMVLAVFDAATPERIAHSDAVCTGLQLVEHWQDVAEDAGRGRVYLPQKDREAFGVRREDLVTAPASDALRRLMAYEARRARDLLAQAAPLLHTLPVVPRLTVAGFAAGGLAALDAIRRSDYDVVSAVRRPRPLDVVRHQLSLLREAR